MDLLIWIIFGGLTGWVASLIMGTNKQQGLLGDIVVGIIGAVIGGYISRALGGQGVTGFNSMSFFIALLGSITLVAIVKLFSRTTS
jgi:uncharacterized membrane protein YeaQ/YmgE (transglycosylase-associated protein family)